MSSWLFALCWKEFHELKWSVLAMSAIALSLPLYTWAREPEAAYTWVIALLFIYSVIGGLFFGMRAAAGERISRASDFLAALPVRPATLGTVKLLGTVIAALIPFSCLVILGRIVWPLAEYDTSGQNGLGNIGTLCAVTVVYLALATAVCGLGQRSEVMAAGRGFVVFALWGPATILAATVAEKHGVVWPYLIAMLGPPLYWGVDLDAIRLMGWIPVMFSCAFIGCLATIFVLRYSAALLPIVERQRSRRTGLSVPRLESRWQALVLKQVFESALLALRVFTATAVLSVVGVLAQLYSESMQFSRPIIQAAGNFAMFACIGGFVLALLLGVSAFAADLEPKISTFWRSRPISPNQWFWTKYAVALATLLLAIGLPALAGFLFAGLAAIGEGASMGEAPVRGVLAIVAAVTFAWFGVFSAAVLATCLVRRPLYAGILALGLVAAALTIPSWIDAGWFGAQPLEHPLLIAIVWLLAAIGATLVAWWAAVRGIAVFQ
jgi:ABC-type transport system involved in multi-copper enzyme maturation permease subunit